MIISLARNLAATRAARTRWASAGRADWSAIDPLKYSLEGIQSASRTACDKPETSFFSDDRPIVTYLLDGSQRSAPHLFFDRRGELMKRLILPGIPVVEQFVYACGTLLDRLLSIGGPIPLAVATVVTYVLFVGKNRRAPA